MNAELWRKLLAWACENDRRETIDLAIALGADDWNYGMMSACRGGHLHIIQEMVHRGADAWNEALRFACRCYHQEIIHYLVANGATNCYACGSIRKHRDQLYKYNAFQLASNTLAELDAELDESEKEPKEKKEEESKEEESKETKEEESKEKKEEESKETKEEESEETKEEESKETKEGQLTLAEKVALLKNQRIMLDNVLSKLPGNPAFGSNAHRQQKSLRDEILNICQLERSLVIDHITYAKVVVEEHKEIVLSMKKYNDYYDEDLIEILKYEREIHQIK